MPVSVGIRHFGDDHAQITFRIIDQPEGNRVEHVPQHAGLRQQHQLAIGDIRQIMGGQNGARSRLCRDLLPAAPVFHE